MDHLLKILDPWWSVIGLTFDLFGFAILALDLGRDYWRTARSDFYKRAAKSARFLIPTEITIDTEEFLASGKEYTDAYKFRNVRDHYENFFVRWAWFRMRLADFRQYGRWFKPEPDFEEMATIFDSLAEEAIEFRYRRAPIYIGIFLILLGFALQIVGSWPG